jgi:chromosome segregation protein
MRLKKIKLAGFKSFVDPTTLDLPSELAAIIGPNGCGKSNVIDAVRWVLGESSAKNLRGESMNDVIFNGSTTRKPVGQASIELIFDNSEGKLVGEFASYTEISVRRQATRDGQSAYFLNGTRCRRRDITELFLGTGLGPRSYAIIEQGMISKLIEARPEDLRAFLEEAAGISLYKKRRQETETRIKHTRENLDRITDISQELEKQLERLKRQSDAAIKFKQYKADQDKLEAELATLHWQVLNGQSTTRSLEIKTLTTALEEKQALRGRIDRELEQGRLEHTDKNDTLNAQQSIYYDLGARIARVEQTLEHYKERQTQLQSDLEQVLLQCAKADAQIQLDKDRLEEVQQTSEALEVKFDTLQTIMLEEEAALGAAEEALKGWTQNFDEFSQEALHPAKTTEVEKSRIEHLERHAQETYHRLQRLNDELANLNVMALELECESLASGLAEREMTHQQYQEKLQELTSEIQHLRAQLGEANKTTNALQHEEQILKGKEASLLTLQQAALGKTNQGVIKWLESTGMEDAPRLGEGLMVESGYEQAIETVLGKALEAVCIGELELVQTVLENLSIGQVMLLDASKQSKPWPMPVSASSTLLSSKILSSNYTEHLQTLLQGVYVVDDLQAAFDLRPHLSASESVITQHGIWLSSQWVKVHKGEEGHTGLLRREADLKEISERLIALEMQLEQARECMENQEEQLQSLETEQEQIRRLHQEVSRQIQGCASELSAKQTRLENAKNRIQQLQEDIAAHQEQLQDGQEEVQTARIALQMALDAMAENTTRKEILLKERDALRTLLSETAEGAKNARTTFHAHALQRETLRTQYQAIVEGIQRLAEQQQSLSGRQSNLQRELNQKDTAEQDRFQLEALLEQRLVVEKDLNEARAALDAIEQDLRSKEKGRSTFEQESETLRAQLESLKMEWQALEVRAQTVQEKLMEFGLSPEQVLETMPKEATEATWAKSLEEITSRIQRLGAINLAAIEEYEIEAERKTYLDMQHKDLMEALETLENAIRKIDKETRQCFKETFDKVNAEFQVLFPKLFGGGQAYLELVGEDLLEAGITVMARPPGKRNSTIHLLSGGEKALTAVSLVFAIFHLNPAPFCMLDEVDAPLDDANVGRFCRLVQHMSQHIQFILITHNKLAMEIAHHLIGVTMKEPGVSRLVSVDMEQAVALIET